MPSATNPSGLIFALTNSTQEMASLQLLKDYGQPDSIVVLLEPRQTVSLILKAGTLYRYSIKKECDVLDISVKIWDDLEWDVSRLYNQAPRPGTTAPGPAGLSIERSWQDYRLFMSESPRYTPITYIAFTPSNLTETPQGVTTSFTILKRSMNKHRGWSGNVQDTTDTQMDVRKCMIMAM